MLSSKVIIKHRYRHSHEYLYKFLNISVYRDLLAVAATSAMMLIEITFSDYDDLEAFELFLMQKLQLSKVTKAPRSDVCIMYQQFSQIFDFQFIYIFIRQDNFLNVSQVIADPDVTNLFFSTSDTGYWSGTLIRIYRGASDNSRRIRMKIYNGYENHFRCKFTHHPHT